MEVADRSNGDVVVTMETISTGTPVFAFVTFDEALGVQRLVGPAIRRKLEVFDDEGHLAIPAAGERLSAPVARRDAHRERDDSTPAPVITDRLVDHAGTDHGPFELRGRWRWLQMVLVRGRRAGAAPPQPAVTRRAKATAVASSSAWS